MTVLMLTESEARRQWAGEMLVVREDRNLLDDLKIMGLRIAALLLLTLPLWRHGVPLAETIPFWLALLLAAGCYGFSHYLMQELKAARDSSGWLFAASRTHIWVNCRSYKHRHWSRLDLTVLALEHEDIERIFAVRFSDDSAAQMAICLKAKLPDDFVDALMNENTRQEPGKRFKPRANHQPVRIEENEQTLRIMFGFHMPRLGQTIDKLRLSYTIDPPRVLPDAETALLPSHMLLNDEVIAETKQVLHSRHKLEAIRYLRARTGISLIDCKKIVDDLS